VANGVAAIGNVGVHHAHRGHSFGRVVTAAVVQHLRRQGLTRFGLNVDRTNAAAIRTYVALGFETAYEFTEGSAGRIG
jgi:ribosomal protein S18 acetylase RimI-like enzyme